MFFFEFYFLFCTFGSFLGHYFPEKLLKDWYKVVFHEEMDLEAPKNICEKISWMKLHADMTTWTRCADKYEVRKYVEEKGLGFTLNKLYGVYENANEIDFEQLPEQFVLKTNNGGGGTDKPTPEPENKPTPENPFGDGKVNVSDVTALINIILGTH